MEGNEKKLNSEVAGILSVAGTSPETKQQQLFLPEENFSNIYIFGPVQ
jgi:hypothetical protein